MNETRLPDQDEQQRWWQRIQWFDVLLVLFALTVLLMLTMELWLPHYYGGAER